MGVGLVAARPLPIWKGLATLTGALVLTELMSPDALQSWATIPGASHFVRSVVVLQPIEGTQLMASGAVLGLGIGWTSRSHRLWRSLHGAMAAATGVSLGWWLGLALWPTASAIHLAAWTVCMAALGSFALWALALSPHVATRIPTRKTIENELEEPYRPLCLEALRLDQAIEQECNDEQCRDGLGEVAAWVYRLQWVLQRMDTELNSSKEVDLNSRLERAEQAVHDSDDRFTQERRKATLSQLHRLSTHLDRIEIERERALALVDFAMVNLEEARAQLVLARLQPGAHAPPSVQEVLIRLRNWTQEQQAEQSSLRELAILA
jgi:hypothetical protein